MTEAIHNISPLILLGIFSAVLSIIAFIPYISDTLARRTEPHRASWFIWSVLSLISFFSQVYEGAEASLWYAGVQTAGTTFIFLISIRFGFGSYLSRMDVCFLGAAAVGIVCWYYTNSAAYALGISIGISLLGGISTISKAYRDPDSETLQMWCISLVASFFAVGSIARFDPILLAYPVYLVVLNTGVVLAILVGRYSRNSDRSAIAIHAPALHNAEPVRVAQTF